jgi:hypothetical protein
VATGRWTGASSAKPYLLGVGAATTGCWPGVTCASGQLFRRQHGDLAGGAEVIGLGAVSDRCRPDAPGHEKPSPSAY